VNAIYNFRIFWIPAITLQYQKAEIFQVGKRKIKNQKTIYGRGNAKIASPRDFYA